MTWFARWKRGTDAQALVSAYRNLPPEHRESSTYTVFDGETYRVFVLTIGRVEWFARQYIEQTAGNPAMSPELD